VPLRPLRFSTKALCLKAFCLGNLVFGTPCAGCFRAIGDLGVTLGVNIAAILWTIFAAQFDFMEMVPLNDVA
jgi:hypothetical protein